MVLAGDTVLFTVRQDDVAAYGLSHPELAADAVERIRRGVIDYRDRCSIRRIATSLSMTMGLPLKQLPKIIQNLGSKRFTRQLLTTFITSLRETLTYSA